MFSREPNTIGLAINSVEKWRLLNDGTLYRISDGAEAGTVTSRTTTITAAQLADLHNTPVELVPARGAGKVIVPTTIMHYANGTGSPFSSNATYVHYEDENGPKLTVSGNAGDDYDLAYDLIDDGLAFSSVQNYETVVLTASTAIANQPLVAFATAAYTVPGAILTTSIGAAGTGYAISDTISIGNAVLTVATVGGGGEVLTYTLTTPGTNNILGDGQATTTDSALGADFTLDIDSLDYSVNPMTLKVKVLYSIFDLN